MSAFAAVVDMAFADPNIGKDATYTPPAGEAVPVRVVTTKAPTDTEFLGHGFQASAGAQRAAIGADLRVAQVAEPVKGARLVVGAWDYPVLDADLDEEGLVWRLTLGKPRAAGG